MAGSARSLNRQLLKALKDIPKEQIAVKNAMEAFVGMFHNLPALIEEEIVPRTAATIAAQTQNQLEKQILEILIKRTTNREARIDAEQAKMHDATRKSIEEALGSRLQEWWDKNNTMVMQVKDYIDQQLCMQQNVINHFTKQAASAHQELNDRFKDIEEKILALQTWPWYNVQTKSG